MTTDTKMAGDKSERHVTDTTIDSIVDEAAAAACAILDREFPGYDVGGITSNFQGLLTEAIRKMLTGVDPLRKPTTTHLNTLVLDDHHFGQPLIRGDLFVVRKTEGSDWDISGGATKCTPRHRYLDDRSLNFVEISSDRIDPYTSFAAAVQGAIQWLNFYGTSQAEAKLHVVPVIMTDDGYKVAPHYSKVA